MKKMQVMGVLVLILISLVVPVVADISTETIGEKKQIGPDILLARGDPLNYYSTDTQIWYWLFGPSNQKFPMYGIGIANTSSALNESQSQDLTPGNYKIMIQTPGTNGVREVIYDPEAKALDSPWKKVKPISIDGLQPYMVMARLLGLTSDTEHCDDPFLKFNMTVEDPMIRITDLYEGANDELYVHGVTNAPTGSTVTLALDPEKFVTAKDRQKNTVNVTATGEVNAYRQFTGYIPLRWDELSIGYHTIRATNNQGVSMDAQRRISMDWSQPEVTPMPYKYVLTDEGLRRYKFTPTPTPTPSVVYVDRYIEKIIFVNVTAEPTPTGSSRCTAHRDPTQNVTAEPTLNQTPVPTETDIHPMPLLPLLAIFVVIGIVLGIITLAKRNNNE